MARIRTIKPEFFTNEKLSVLGADTHLLAAALLTYADDDGYFNAHPGLIKAACCPLRKDEIPLEISLNNLSCIKFVQFGIGNDGRRYGRVLNFLEHQRVSHPTASKIKNLDIQWESFPENLRNPHENHQSSHEVLRPELNRIELNRINICQAESSGGKSPEKSYPQNAELKKQAIEVLDFLNRKTGRSYRPVDANLKLIIARLKSGATVVDCKQVIAKKRMEWEGNEKMAEYLRPKTLFNATNFEQYVGELLPEDTGAQNATAGTNNELPTL